MSGRTLFSIRTVTIINSIPKGKVATYGQIAAMAGNARAARQVARLLNTLSGPESLPWQRVVNREGKISLDPVAGGDLQARLLELEGVQFQESGCIDLIKYGWSPMTNPMESYRIPIAT